MMTMMGRDGCGGGNDDNCDGFKDDHDHFHDNDDDNDDDDDDDNDDHHHPHHHNHRDLIPSWLPSLPPVSNSSFRN